MPSCVIIVENLPVPLDRRVWQEARALQESGWAVSVICPATERFPARREIIDGIRIFRHPLPLEAKGIWGFFIEYGMALFHQTRLLISVRWSADFDIIQACNPPDLLFLVALPWKLFGKKFVFDHHDVCPELMEAKFGKKRFLQPLLFLAERLTFKAADLVISANESFRQLAISRGGKSPEDVVAVYSIPDKRFFSNANPDSSTDIGERIRGGKSIVIGYVGIVGDQDGVDNVVRMALELLKKHSIEDFTCVIVGDGPALPSVKALAVELGVCEHVTFTGYLSGTQLIEALSEFDIGVIPDTINPYNDKISMNKVFEYCAMGLPIVAFDLSETKRLLKDAALIATDGNASGLAEQVERLIRDPELRHELGQKAKALADREFVWEAEARRYVAAMTRLFEDGRAQATQRGSRLGFLGGRPRRASSDSRELPRRPFARDRSHLTRLGTKE
jgi:glycosyltransferase involved in cell wall biosynthesis